MLLFTALLVLKLQWVSAIEGPPHIIFILADDLGWNDVSFHGSPQIPTPNIDALAASSIILNNYYSESICTPSRSSLMTGKYPIHIGLQHSIIKSGEPTGLPLDVMMMPEHLKNKGYMAHIIGKWHLGYSKKEYTPTSRGFDSFFGFYNEQIDYYDYTNLQRPEDPQKSPLYGIDLHDGTETIKNLRGRYATEVFTERAVDVIASHNESNPLFLYFAHLAPHSGNDYMPLQAPLSHVAKNRHIKDSKRRIYAGVVSALDESIGKIVSALNERDFLQNSIIVFTSDNGGETSNWPLRGQQKSSWEGAIRVPTLIWSPLLMLTEPRTSTQLMHVSDWLPTLYAAAGGDLSDLGPIDGFNMWEALISNSPSPRIEILHNIDAFNGALRRGDYKLIIGAANSLNNMWYAPPELQDFESPISMDEWVFKNESIVKNILEQSELWISKGNDTWRNNATVVCNQPPPDDNGNCDPDQKPCLFNVAADPCEYINLANRYPRIVRSMLGILKRYNTTAIDPLSADIDPSADPRCNGFAFVSWMDGEETCECPFS